MSTETPTPRTDAESVAVGIAYHDWIQRGDAQKGVACFVVPTKLAATLERELAAARAEITHLRAMLKERGVKFVECPPDAATLINILRNTK